MAAGAGNPQSTIRQSQIKNITASLSPRTFRRAKNDPIYNAHSYHTKVPHKAIMRYIPALHPAG